MINLLDIRAALVAELGKHNALPCHVGAFCAWMHPDGDALRNYVDQALHFAGQMRHPEHIAALGYGAAGGLLTPEECELCRSEIAHLSGRAFFAPGRPLRFEVDGIALLGVSLGAAKLAAGVDNRWLASLLVRSAEESGDQWQLGLVRSARLAIGERELRIVPPDFAIAMKARGIGELHGDDLSAGWQMTAQLSPHKCGPAREAVRLAVLDYTLARLGGIAIAGTTRDDLVNLLQNIARSMRRWSFETSPRTSRSKVAKWEVENEYHVQNLLWVVLAPLFADLEDEENLPSLGHKHPRADLGIPSLKTIIEVKFMRHAGQAACANIIEEIAADASLYLSKSTVYDNIIAFVWDDCAQTEQHHELKIGIEDINGISAAILLPRPSIMARPKEKPSD